MPDVLDTDAGAYSLMRSAVSSDNGNAIAIYPAIETAPTRTALIPRTSHAVSVRKSEP